MSHKPAKLQTRRTVSMRAELVVTLKRARDQLGLPVAAMVDRAITEWLRRHRIPIVDREEAVAELAGVPLPPEPWRSTPEGPPCSCSASDTEWINDPPYGGSCML